MMKKFLLALVAVFMAAMMVTAVADDNRIHPVCDDTKTPRCWVPHPDQPSRLVPVNKPPADAPQVAPQRSPLPPEVRAQMVRPLPPPGYGGDPYGHQPYGYGRPLMFRFGPLFLFVR
jgi:hypothetical protein